MLLPVSLILLWGDTVKILNIRSLCFIAAMFWTAASCAADPASAFKEKVSALHGLTADFSQHVFDESGDEIDSSSGTFKLNSDSHSFFIKTVSPNESLLTSNGKEIYHYENDLEQVTIYSIDMISKTSPLWIVLDHTNRDFSDYTIKMSGKNSFQLTEKNKSEKTGVYNIAFDDQGLSGVEVIDPNGQKIVYELSNRKFIRTIPSVEFVFLMPNGVTVDDKR